MQIKDPMHRGGKVSASAKETYKLMTRRDLTVEEARLLPYLRYRATNGGYLEHKLIRPGELVIIKDLCASGLMVMNSDHKIGLTKNLFDMINMIEWDVYCTQAVDDE